MRSWSFLCASLVFWVAVAVACTESNAPSELPAGGSHADVTADGNAQSAETPETPNNAMAGQTVTGGTTSTPAAPVAGSAGQGVQVSVAGSAASAGTPAAGAPAQSLADAGAAGGDAATGAGGAQSGGAGGAVAGAAGSGGATSPAGGRGEGGSSSDPAAGSGGTAGNPSAAGSAGSAGDAAGSGGTAGQAGSAGADSAAAGSGDAAGAGGSAGVGGSGAAGASGASGPPAPVCSGPPGLYSGTTCTDLAPGVEAFVPQFPLVTDDGQGHTALKARWVYLPAGSSIDTSSLNRWTYPVGTIFFKQFADPKSGKRVETRRLEKLSAASGYASWSVQSYAWSSDQLSVSVAPTAGVANALGTGFDIPSTSQCKQCHQLVGTTNVDAPIGFNAIQLNHQLGGLDLATLLLRGQLRNASNPANPNITLDNAVVPGTAVQRAGVGYLHGNCSHCHGGPSPHGHQLLWTPVGTTNLTDLPMFSASTTGVVCHCLDLWRGHSDGSTPYRYRINPGSGSSSGIIGRLSANATTSPRDAMPPVGRKGSDPIGIATVKAFIDSLDGSACAANPPNCSP